MMNLADNSIRPPLTNFKWGVVDPAWSPDGQSIAFGAFSDTASFPELYYLELKGGKIRQLTKNAFTDREPVFSPDGKRLFFASDESPLPDAAFGILHVASVPVAGGKAEFFTEDENSSTHPGITHDGKSVLLVRISTASGRHSLWQYSMDGKEIRSLTETKFARIHRYIYTPDGNLMVIWGQEEAERQDQVYLLDVKTGAVRDLPEPDVPKRSPSLSPDGKLLAFMGPSRVGVHLYVYDLGSGEMKQLTEKGNNYSPVFISNSVIFFGSDRDNEKELYQIDLSEPVTDKDKKK
jgi:Tol biopolymer transport system component